MEVTNLVDRCYKITAHTCDAPYITYHRNNLTRDEALSLVDELSIGFRSIDITNDVTGEVCLTRYQSSDFYSEMCSPWAAIGCAELFVEANLRKENTKND